MKLRILIAFLFPTILAFGQLPEQDCVGAIVLCENSYNFNTPYSGFGYVNEINVNQSCLGSGENNGIWFKFISGSNGHLGFNIIPTDPTYDFDWAVFNLTGKSCSEIYYNQSLEISCNFSGSTFPTNATGANGGINPQDAPTIAVLEGEVYYILVSNFSNANSDFVLDLSLTTADITPGIVQLSSVLPPTLCNANQLNVYFNQPVLCSSISIDDFQLLDNNSQLIPINSISMPECMGNSGYSSSLMLNLTQPLVSGNQYSLEKTGNVAGLCNNIGNQQSSLDFTASAVGIDSFNVVQQYCNGVIIYPVINGAFAQANESWIYPDELAYNHIPYHANDDGVYSVMLSSTTGCQISFSDTVDVFNPAFSQPTMHFSGDTIFCDQNFFASYVWFVDQSFGTYQDTTYAPENYIVIPGWSLQQYGEVFLRVYTDSGCSNYNSIAITGILENPLAKIITLNTYVTDILKVNIASPLTGLFTMYDVTGRPVTNQRIENTTTLQLDMGSYANGIYILTFTNSKGQSYSAKVVKAGY